MESTRCETYSIDPAPYVSEIDKLAEFLYEHYDHQIGLSNPAGESAVDLAIRLITEMSERITDTKYDSAWVYEGQFPETAQFDPRADRRISRLVWFVLRNDTNTVLWGRRVVQGDRVYWSAYNMHDLNVRVFSEDEVRCWKYDVYQTAPQRVSLERDLAEVTTWHKNFITINDDGKLVTVWDETQANILCSTCSSIADAVIILDNHANSLTVS